MSDGPDLASLLRELDDHGVAYLVGGSVAAMAHGVPDIQPADLDVIPATDPANLRRLSEALGGLGATTPVETGEWQTDAAGDHEWVEDGIARPPAPLDPQDPASFDHSFTTPRGRLDVVPRVAGSYGELRSRASCLPVAGREVWVAHPIDVLAGVTRPRRPKDGPRVRHLRAIALRSGTGHAQGVRMTQQDDPAKRVDHPGGEAADLPYDEEMTEPDEANAPDAEEDLPSNDERIGR